MEEFLYHKLTKEMLKARNNRNMTALHLAYQEGHHGVVRKLEPHLNAEDMMQENREKNALVMTHNAQTDAEEDDVKTPLHLAAEKGYHG